jgi:hypothetical protein
MSIIYKLLYCDMMACVRCQKVISDKYIAEVPAEMHTSE